MTDPVEHFIQTAVKLHKAARIARIEGIMGRNLTDVEMNFFGMVYAMGMQDGSNISWEALKMNDNGETK